MKLYKEAARVESYLSPEIKDYKRIVDLLHVTEDYLNLTVLQRKRLKVFDETDFEALDDKQQEQEFLLYFGDIHFLFSCAHKFMMLAERLIKQLRIEKTPYFCELKKYHADSRNHFEHIDERIDRHPIYRMAFSTVINNRMTVNEIDYDVSDEVLTPLYFIYEYIIKNIDDKYGYTTV
ncbi:hypothetical protein [Sporosarcina sp. P29]|uniref:hypothetical protein n=1 Tax=Sporosarcina sp. P29 TaxID=2048252 RepID=UPI000C166460|nr:hypothetical protein [Sporosarcina sp. P29]PID00801.1 hypothetical protein CSV68_00845 [Sporosarcina sp. P29]